VCQSSDFESLNHLINNEFLSKYDCIMALVIHLIPYFGIGGVERAAASMITVSTEDFEFRVETIFPPSAAKCRWKLWNPFLFIYTAVRLWQSRPEVLIVSLWRSCAVGILLKLLQPKLRLVVFVHLSQDVHKPDQFLTQVAVRLAYRVWADSKQTLRQRLPLLVNGKGQVISFITERIDALPSVHVSPTFIFWGRLHAQKGIKRALNIFASIQAKLRTAQFWIIGPDGGELRSIKKELMKLGVYDSVKLLGEKEFLEIKQVARNVSFYLQTSEMEGMAMSVVEAMQLGLVPVVTPVGEIANYALHTDNALVVSDDESAVIEVLALLDDNMLYQAMRERAISTWLDKALYKNSVLEACLEILHGNDDKDYN
jgi:glycosyltransferase involved in cell wall biosynthesis